MNSYILNVSGNRPLWELHYYLRQKKDPPGAIMKKETHLTQRVSARIGADALTPILFSKYFSIRFGMMNWVVITGERWPSTGLSAMAFFHFKGNTPGQVFITNVLMTPGKHDLLCLEESPSETD